MQILFILTQDLESPSGLGRYLPLAKELNKLGHTANIAALHANYKNLKETKFDFQGVQVDYVAPMHIKKIGDNKSYYSNTELALVVSRATWELSRRAIKANADIIHIAKPHPMNGIAGLITKYIRNQLIFLDCDDYEAGSGNFQNFWQRRIVAAFEKSIPKRVDMVSTNTMFMKDNLISWGVPQNQILYLPNGIDRERFSPPDKDRVMAFRRELALENKYVVAYIGTLSLVSHPVDLLINAFITVKKVVPDSVLLLVGGGEDIEYLRSMAIESGLSDSIRFCGRVTPSLVPIYYALAHVTVDPVYGDSAARGRSPLKLFESWACQVPFITADVGDRRQLMGEPPAGLLALPGDANSLAQNITKVLTKQIDTRKLVKNGHERVQNYYWDRLVSDLEFVYLEKSSIAHRKNPKS